MGHLLAFWKRRFLKVEFVFAILLTVIFTVWYYDFDGLTATSALLKDNRAVLFGTTASILGSLLGFVITAEAYCVVPGSAICGVRP